MSVPDKKAKERLNHMVDVIYADTEEELDYCVSRMMMNYCRAREPLTHDLLNKTMGAVSLAVSTFQARVYGPFHAQQAREKGDPYQEFIRDSNLKTLFG